MKLSLAAFLILTFLLPFKDVQRKIISDSEFNYTFYVLTENVNVDNNTKFYYWFKSSEIHSSQGSSSGNLLHGTYTKSYKDNNLAEQGEFKKGLKNEVWKRWYENGQLYEVSKWKNGSKMGRYLQFSETGKVLIQGNYRNNKKHGFWIDEVSNDTLYFKKGKEIKKPNNGLKRFTKKTKLFIKKLFTKKEKDNLQEQSLRRKATNPENESSARKKRAKKEKNKKRNKENKEE